MDFPVAMTLKQARELKGYKQEEAAKLIGISKDTLGNMKEGRAILMFRSFEKLRSYMECHITGLFFYLWITIKP